MLCIYPMEDDSAESIESTVAKIRTLRLEYPNLRHISTNNRDAILTELNSRFGTTLEVDDIWGTRTTTVKNQFYYLRDHLCQFTSIFEKDRTGNIVLKDSGVEELTRLLEQSKRVETLSREDFLAYYRSLSDVN